MDNFELPNEAMDDSLSLCNFLKHYQVDEETIDILKNENVTGRTLPDITESDLKEMTVKLGPRKRLMQVIKSINQNQQQGTAVSVHQPPGPSFFYNDDMQQQDPGTVLFTDMHCIDYNQQESVISQEENEINIKLWLESHSQGKELAQRLKEENYKIEDRQLLIRIVCAKLIKLCGSVYPSSDLKSRVAQGIVKDFPSLKSKTFAKGHESFYDEATGQGFLEYRLKTVRKSLSPSKKKRSLKKIKVSGKAETLTENLLDPEILEEKVQWMKFKNPTDANRKSIEKALAETMADRQKEIHEKNMTVTEILSRYPRLQDYTGDMIDREFTEKYPDCDSFLGKFSSFYAPRIIEYVERFKPDLLRLIYDLDDSLKALVLLPELLPAPNYGKGKGKKGQGKSTNFIATNEGNKRIIPSSELLLFINGNQDVLSTADAGSRSKQPYLICTFQNNQKYGQFFIKVEQKIIEVGNHPMKAFDLLFKFHFVLNIEYATSLRNFYDFISGCVYKISKPRASSDSFNSCLFNIAVDLDKIIMKQSA